jgi:2-dehydropantoate 2-reductase
VCDASTRFAALYEGSQAEMRVTEQYHTELWRKLGLNATSNGVTALTRKRFNVFEDPRIGELGERVLLEAWTVGNADGADLDLGTVPGISKFLAKQGEESATSTYYDRMAGRPTEHDAIYGAIVRAGARLGVPTPFNETIWALLAAGD